MLSEQIEDSIGPTLTRKMHGQGQRAQDAGAKYVILIDWAGGDHIAQGTHWLPRHPATVRKAVTNVLKSLAQTPDSVYLLDRADRWHALYEKSASNQHVSGSASGT